MKKICPLPLAATIIIVSYAIMSLFISVRDMILLTDALAITFSVSVAIVYWSRVRKAIFSLRPTVYDLLITGISWAWSITTLDRSWRLTGRVLHQTWMMDSWVISFLLTGLAFCAGLHLMALAHDPSESAHKVAHEAWWIIFFTLVGGVILGISVIKLDMIGAECLLDLSRCH